MKVRKAESEAKWRCVVDIATRSIMTRGINGASIQELVFPAGLTHGGFYRHFASKDDLIARAIAEAITSNHKEWRRNAKKGNETPLASIVSNYVSRRRRDTAEIGCVLATLGTEIPRCNQKVKAVFEEGLEGYIAILVEAGASSVEGFDRQSAIAVLSAMVGCMILARAVEEPRLSAEILDAVTSHLRVEIAKSEEASAS